MKRTVEVLWWGEDGPVYEVTERRSVYELTECLSGFHNRRCRMVKREVGSLEGDEYVKASFHLPYPDILLLNRGYEYELTMRVDGVEETALVDALDDYAVFSIPPGIELLDVLPVGQSSEPEPEPEPQSPLAETSVRDGLPLIPAASDDELSAIIEHDSRSTLRSAAQRELDLRRSASRAESE